MNKKVGKMTLSMALAAALAFAPAQAFAAPATDISGHWAEKVITQWQEKGLISGYEDGTFKPDNSVTRAEFVIMLNKALGFTQKGNVTFSDVSANAWYYDAVAIAVACVIKVVGYYIAEVILYHNLFAPAASIPGNLVQIGTAAVIVLICVEQLRKVLRPILK